MNLGRFFQIPSILQFQKIPSRFITTQKVKDVSKIETFQFNQNWIRNVMVNYFWSQKQNNDIIQILLKHQKYFSKNCGKDDPCKCPPKDQCKKKEEPPKNKNPCKKKEDPCKKKKDPCKKEDPCKKKKEDPCKKKNQDPCKKKKEDPCKPKKEDPCGKKPKLCSEETISSSLEKKRASYPWNIEAAKAEECTNEEVEEEVSNDIFEQVNILDCDKLEHIKKMDDKYNTKEYLAYSDMAFYDMLVFLKDERQTQPSTKRKYVPKETGDGNK